MPHRRGRKRTGGYRALPLSSCEEVAHALVRFLLFSEINFLIAPHATTRRPAVLLSFPVPGRRGKDGLTARRFWCPIERVRGRPPDGIVGRRPMRLQCCLVPINFVEIVDVLVLRVLKDVEAHAPRLIPLGAEGIHLDRLQEALALARLHPDLHPHRQHAASLLTARVPHRAQPALRHEPYPDATLRNGGGRDPPTRAWSQTSHTCGPPDC